MKKRPENRPENTQGHEYTQPGCGEFDAVAEHYDYLMRSVPYEAWVNYVERLLRRHHIEAHRVLDLCCGTGRVGSELLRRGYQVWGIDLSEQMVRRCSLQSPPLPAAVMDARRLGLRPGTLDLVVSLYDSLNYILSPEELGACFRGVASALRDEGWFIFDMNTIFALSAGLFANTNRGTGDVLEYEWRPTYDPASRICRVDMTFVWSGEGGPRRYTEVHYQRGYELRELRELLAQAGFDHVRFYHAYSFRRPHRWTDRIYVVARKGITGEGA
ncbi:MAG: class I SAM-dependent methyltransferase [Armatimonadetes bacterium]|nr:class I SAM-dependent methyltransferase [Armatimonadota bacterium]